MVYFFKKEKPGVLVRRIRKIMTRELYLSFAGSSSNCVFPATGESSLGPAQSCFPVLEVEVVVQSRQSR